jgi:hypothetical protein
VWTWDRAARELHYTDITSPLTAGWVVALTLNIACPFLVQAESVTGYPIQKLFRDEAETTWAGADAVAQGYLTRGLALTKKVIYTTTKDGLVPGTKQTIQHTGAGVNGTFILTQVDIQAIPGSNRLRYTVTAVDQDAYSASWLDRWRALVVGVA